MVAYRWRGAAAVAVEAAGVAEGAGPADVAAAEAAQVVVRRGELAAFAKPRRFLIPLTDTGVMAGSETVDPANSCLLSNIT